MASSGSCSRLVQGLVDLNVSLQTGRPPGQPSVPGSPSKPRLSGQAAGWFQQILDLNTLMAHFSGRDDTAEHTEPSPLPDKLANTAWEPFKKVGGTIG